MPIFCFKFQPNDKINDYIATLRHNLKSDNIVKNPFKGGVELIGQSKQYAYYVMRIDPVYPNYGLYILFFTAITNLILGWHSFFWIPYLLSSIAFLWSSIFYKLVLFIVILAKFRVRIRFCHYSIAINFMYFDEELR